MRQNWNGFWNIFSSVSDKFVSKSIAKWWFIKVFVDFILLLYRDGLFCLKFSSRFGTDRSNENLLQYSWNGWSSIFRSIANPWQNNEFHNQQKEYFLDAIWDRLHYDSKVFVSYFDSNVVVWDKHHLYQILFQNLQLTFWHKIILSLNPFGKNILLKMDISSQNMWSMYLK